jgi:twitching motility two-component system response regulator PilH
MGKLALVVEDDPDQQKLLERMLSGVGYRVVTAGDGVAGLNAATATPPDVVLLDIMMPRMNGYQTCRALKEHPATAHVPVIILTRKEEPADQFWAAEVGAAAFLNKPVDLPRLLETIARCTGST